MIELLIALTFDDGRCSDLILRAPQGTSWHTVSQALRSQFPDQLSGRTQAWIRRSASFERIEPKTSPDEFNLQSGDHIVFSSSPDLVCEQPLSPSETTDKLAILGGYNFGDSTKFEHRDDVWFDYQASEFDQYGGSLLLRRTESDLTLRYAETSPGKHDVRGNGRPIDSGQVLELDVVVSIEETTRLGIVSVDHSESGWQNTESNYSLGRIAFHRQIGDFYGIEPPDASIDTDQSDPPRPQFPLISLLGSSTIAISSVILFDIADLRRLLFFATWPLLSLLGYLEQLVRARRESRSKSDAASRAQKVHASNWAAYISSERTRRLELYPDLTRLVDAAVRRSSLIWSRSPKVQGNFLRIRVGFTQYVHDMHDSHSCDERAELPLILSLNDRSILTIVADASERHTLLRFAGSLLFQILALHSPNDLTLHLLLGSDNPLLDTLKWSPHVSHTSGRRGWLDVPIREQSDDIADYISELEHEMTSPTPEGHRRLLVVDQLIAQSSPKHVGRLLELTDKDSISVIWLGASPPPYSDHEVTIVQANLAEYSVAGQRHSIAFVPDVPRMPLLRQATMRLSALTDAYASAGLSDLPTAPSLTDATEVPSQRDQLMHRWNELRWEYGVRCSVGVGERGPVFVDLVRQGPHALIGGQSGSGKSEVLTTILASLIADNSPARLSLLLVDYKGGATIDEFRHAPHCVGYLTDLQSDSIELHRFRVGLETAIKEREAYFARLNERRQGRDMESALRNRASDVPPFLVVLIDEFAELGAEDPGLLETLTRLARKGRSLGILMVLATQSPARAIPPEMRSNCNIFISLKVEDAGQSEAVLRSSIASTISSENPGRGFLRIGSGEICAFQAPHASESVQRTEGAEAVSVQPFFGKGTDYIVPSYSSSAPHRATQPQRELDVLLGNVELLADLYEPLETLCPDKLPVEIDMPELWWTEEPRHSLYLGELNDLDARKRRQLCPDLNEGGVLVCGGVRSGKTTALKTAILSCIAKAVGNPDVTPHVVMFSDDDSLRDLVRLQPIRFCGMVSNDEDIRDGLELLKVEVDDRIQAKASRDLQEEHGPIDYLEVPILVVVDDLDKLLRETGKYEHAQLQEELVSLISTGQSVGTRLVASSTTNPSRLPRVVRTLAPHWLLMEGLEPDGIQLLTGNRSAAKMLSSTVRRAGHAFFGRHEVQVARPPADWSKFETLLRDRHTGNGRVDQVAKQLSEFEQLRQRRPSLDIPARKTLVDSQLDGQAGAPLEEGPPDTDSTSIPASETTPEAVISCGPSIAEQGILEDNKDSGTYPNLEQDGPRGIESKNLRHVGANVVLTIVLGTFLILTIAVLAYHW